MRLYEYLQKDSYPGRGIAVAKSPCGGYAFAAYFVMGRSASSRNRIIINQEGIVKTKAFDESGMADPSLFVYNAVRVFGDSHIITNGDQTDTIYDGLQQGKSFAQALRTREYEPDSLCTPRISCLLTAKDGDMSYKLSILKKSAGNNSSDRFFYEYNTVSKGTGNIIHTYFPGESVPSFVGEPAFFEIEEDFAVFGEKIWAALDKDNKVGLWTCKVCLESGKTEEKIFNVR